MRQYKQPTNQHKQLEQLEQLTELLSVAFYLLLAPLILLAVLDLYAYVYQAFFSKAATSAAILFALIRLFVSVPAITQQIKNPAVKKRQFAWFCVKTIMKFSKN